MQILLDAYDAQIRRTACCVRNDGGGCYQSSRDDCPVRTGAAPARPHPFCPILPHACLTRPAKQRLAESYPS